MNLNKLFKLSKLLLKLSELKTDKGVLVSDEELAEGVAVSVDKDGELVPAEDGEYKAEDKVVTVKDGKVEKIEEVIPEVEEALKDEPKEEPKEEPKDEPKKEELEEAVIDPRVAELEATIVEKDAKIAELEAKVKELEDKLKAPVEEGVKLSKIITTAEESTNPYAKYFKKK